MFLSWASGIATAGGMPYRQGRNQESSSEAVAGYYGVALLGDALGHRQLGEMGRVLLGMEVQAARRAVLRAHARAAVSRSRSCSVLRSRSRFAAPRAPTSNPIALI
jgi:endoglucanase Acf2